VVFFIYEKLNFEESDFKLDSRVIGYIKSEYNYFTYYEHFSVSFVSCAFILNNYLITVFYYLTI
jgi:hypothetical protein